MGMTYSLLHKLLKEEKEGQLVDLALFQRQLGLGTRLGVDLGTGYKNNQACATFVHYIAKEQRDHVQSVLAKSKFFSIQADGRTDSGNVEDELYVVLYFDSSGSNGKVHVRSKLFAVRQPKGCNAKSLFDSQVTAMDYVSVSDWKDKLFGFGCDGASVNIAARGVRGYITQGHSVLCD